MWQFNIILTILQKIPYILEVKKEVPHGSILGPLFFMYVGIITQFIPERNITKYTKVTAILQL